MDSLAIWLVVLIGATVQGMTGLGFGLIAVPILILFLDPRSVIVTTLILSVVLNGLILFQARKHVVLRDAWPITLGAMLGVPFGTHLLTVLSPELLKELVAVLVLLFSIPLLLGYSRSFRHPRAASLIVGAVSGTLQSSISIGAPPVVLFMASQRIPKETFRGTLVLRSMAASLLSVVALVPSGLVNPEVAANALLLAPALLVGFAAGTRLLRSVPQALFKKVTILLVFAAALFSLAGSLL